MVGPSDTTGGEDGVLSDGVEVLAGGWVLSAAVMAVRYDEAAVLDDRTALPHGLGPMAALPELLEPGPTLRWYSLCRTAGSTGPERAGRPAARREEVIWLRLDRSSRSCVRRSWRRDWRDVLLVVAREVLVLVVVDRALLTAVRAVLVVPFPLQLLPKRRWFDGARVDDDDAAMMAASLPVVARGMPAAAASGCM